MTAKFYITHLEKGVELSYETARGYKPLVKRVFPDLEALEQCLEQLQNEVKPGYCRVYVLGKSKFSFELRDKDKTILLEGIDYKRCQSAEKSMKSVVRSLPTAVVKEIITR